MLELVGFVIAIGRNGLGILGYYTQESNLFLLIATGIYLYYLLAKKEVPSWAARLKYIATCLVAVTFIVVVLVLAPMCLPNVKYAVYVIVGGANFFHHLTCPVLAIVSFFACEVELIPTTRDAVIAMMPTLLYAIVTTTLNAAKVIVGPYPFLHVYEQPVIVSVLWFIIIPGGGFLFAYLVSKVKKKISKKKSLSVESK